MTCAITGASGYVGSRLASAIQRDMEVVPISRREAAGSIRWEMQNPTEISEELRSRGVKVLVHAAWDFTHPNAEENDRVNVEGSRQLFESADRAGVERILFISSISAFAGARSAYGQSKLRVERMVFDRPGGIVIRPGLVWGAGPGGMFGALTKQVESGSMIPMIGSGRYPQYLVHEDDLGDAIRKAVAGGLKVSAPITVANEVPWLLRDLIEDIARKQGKKVTLLPVPWPAVYAGLKAAELMGAKLNFRSDSVLSLVFQDPSPDFTPANQLGLARRSYPGTPA
ncbi:NAD-dependent epimerase/dehydratase family protein [Granulicella aggregans]|jgi:nucleoside-diphosphate-sugar epimerase|uniref:NAD-dependent epimerase/dehydratase family protein n=1 Tax=Granulicella aggregans TaxID=474949 RepID=UPI0021DFB0D8|nr:NAD-dependent epimerase/dehydratase family protein [Granulicella aggregans]